MLDFGLGELALHPEQFWELTYTEVERMAAGYHRRETSNWQRTRFLVSGMYNARRGPDDEPVQPEQLMWLPGDKKTDASPMEGLSDAEYAAELQRLENL